MAERVGNGDRTAMDELYQEIRSNLLRQLEPPVTNSGLTALDIDDLCHATFVQVVEKIHLYDPRRGSLSTWTLRVARNLFYTQCRSERRAAQALERMPIFSAVSGPSTCDGDATRQRIRVLREVIEHLDPLDRLRFHLIVELGMSNAELADLLDLQRTSVRTMKAIFLKKLRTLLCAYPEFSDYRD
jgi:RNA polymerase sigma factor (sigma-70 family)